MNWLDLAIIISLTISGIVGWRHGFSKVVAVVIGIALGVYLAGRFGASVGEALTFIESARLAAVAGYGVVFAGVFIALMIAAQAVRKSLGMVLLGWVDGAGGAVLGLAAGVIVWYGIVTAAAALPFESIDDTIENSDMAMFMSERVATVLELLPGEYRGLSDLLDKIPKDGTDLESILNAGESLLE